MDYLSLSMRIVISIFSLTIMIYYFLSYLMSIHKEEYKGKTTIHLFILGAVWSVISVLNIKALLESIFGG